MSRPSLSPREAWRPESRSPPVPRCPGSPRGPARHGAYRPSRYPEEPGRVGTSRRRTGCIRRVGRRLARCLTRLPDPTALPDDFSDDLSDDDFDAARGVRLARGLVGRVRALAGSVDSRLPGSTPGSAPSTVSPEITAQLGHARGPWSSRTFSATAICCERLARSAREAYAQPPYYFQVVLRELETAVEAVAEIGTPHAAALALGDPVPGRGVGRVRAGRAEQRDGDGRAGDACGDDDGGCLTGATVSAVRGAHGVPSV